MHEKMVYLFREAGMQMQTSIQTPINKLLHCKKIFLHQAIIQSCHSNMLPGLFTNVKSHKNGLFSGKTCVGKLSAVSLGLGAEWGIDKHHKESWESDP